MQFTAIEQGGVTLVEGRPDAPFLRGVEDAVGVLEACFSAAARAALLYAENLPAAVFDLGSGCTFREFGQSPG